MNYRNRFLIRFDVIFLRFRPERQDVRDVLNLQYRFRKLRPLLDNFDFSSDDHKKRTLDFVRYESREIFDRVKFGRVGREEMMDRLKHCHELLDDIEMELRLGPPNISSMHRLEIVDGRLRLEKIF